MARIIDKDTRLIDVDFGPLTVACSRIAGDTVPTTITAGQNGTQQLLVSPENALVKGSFIQYSRIDLEYMTMNNEVMQPIEVSVQRTSPVPLGSNNNGNNFDQIEEFIYIFSRPLNNEDIRAGSGLFDSLRSLGLDRSQVLSGGSKIGGADAGIPTHEQTIYAEKRMYSYNKSLMATVTNGELTTPPGPLVWNTLAGMPVLDSITTWGTLSAITGPNLHCYRIVINRTQNLPSITELSNLLLDGSSSLAFPPVNITLLCKDPNYTEGQYLTRLANAMNSIPEGGLTQDS
jgi:hypothetical protein